MSMEHLQPRFFITMDVAKAAEGGWVVLEVGDGGVSRLPPKLKPEAFYEALRQALGGIGPG